MDSLNIRDSYKYYKTTARRLDFKPQQEDDYVDLVAGFFKYMMGKLIDGDDICLTANLGMLGIRGRKARATIDDKTGEIRGILPNWRRTKELWDSDPVAKENKVLVYNFNEHSNGLVYNIIWRKNTAKFTNKNIYSLKFSRENKRAVSKLIFEGKEYLQSLSRTQIRPNEIKAEV